MASEQFAVAENNPRKYALVERERRFTVSRLPESQPVAVRHITDLYIAGTRLRLRKSEGTVDGQPELVFKLTQKLPFDGSHTAGTGEQGLITNTYLSFQEFVVLSGLKGRTLTKTRFSYPPMGVDVFEGSLSGLVIAEAEFADAISMEEFRPPPWCGTEITSDARFTGGNFSRLLEDGARAEIKELLSIARPPATSA